ncbi:MAG: methylenetetrahydrofolate reductase [NAD(P)H] [Candidatus Saganbacteria bacterium]|nr:methylenetetrahydrofolate reductase [NAD(P)H] [Candidatus Saganbacteria bacterium]
MKVIEALRSGKPTLSFEFFPPKGKKQEENLFAEISELRNFNPDFVSVTYGALGGTKEKTFFLVKEIKEKFGMEPLAHLTCVAATKAVIREQIEELDKLGIKNILALRGDSPEGGGFVPPAEGFRFAADLVSFVKKEKPDFCIGVAGYPEGHREAQSLEKDIEHLREKVEAGADYIISQLFFDNSYFFDFLGRCEKAKISVPIIPGLMPITSLKQIKKMTKICGATIPSPLLKKLEKCEYDKKATIQIGIEQAVLQCDELIKSEVPGLHFFVLNQSGPISEILKLLKK